MENKKSNRNSIIILLIAIIVVLATSLVLLSTGTISFNGEGNKTEEKPQPIETNDTDLFTKLVGTYSYKGEYVDKEENADGSSSVADDAWTSGKMATEKLVLNSSGIAEASAGNVRAGGYSAKGKWYISNNELIINNEICTPGTTMDGDVTYGNCNPVWTYTYKIEDNKVVITSNNNSMVTVTLVKE